MSKVISENRLDIFTVFYDVRFSGDFEQFINMLNEQTI